MSRPWKFKKGDQVPAWASGGSYIEGLQFGDDVTLIENTTAGGFFVIGGPDQDATAQQLAAQNTELGRLLTAATEGQS